MSDASHSERFDQALAAWKKTRERYKDKLHPGKTLSGIPLKTVYTKDDVQGLDLDEMPGVYPFTRGLYPDGYALTPWMQQMVFGYGTAEETREKMERMVAEGMEGYFGHNVFNVVYDIPCMYGIDADHPEAEGNLGQCGVHMSTGDDYDELIRGWELERTNISMITGENRLRRQKPKNLKRLLKPSGMRLRNLRKCVPGAIRLQKVKRKLETDNEFYLCGKQSGCSFGGGYRSYRAG